MAVDRSAERALLERMVAGDDGALAIAYDLHAEVVFGLARRVTRDEEAAREITQEVFTLLWQHPERVDPARGSLKSYLGVIAHRRSVDFVRSAVRRARAESGLAGRAEGSDDAEAGVDEAMARAWRSERLRALIDRLPREEGEALVLAYYDGHTYKEVARLLAIPEGTAKSRLRRALERLRTGIHDDTAAWAP
jgi:RNA polymerase sigma-70 factor (ECF subfamily)